MIALRKLIDYQAHEKVVSEALAHKLDHLMDEAHSGAYVKGGWQQEIRRRRLAGKLWATYKAYRDLR